MTTSKGRMLTRGVKRSVLNNPDQVQLLDKDTQEQLLAITKLKTPSSQKSILTLSQSPASKVTRKSGSTAELKQELESTLWVQCDNPECYKWRRVSVSDLEDITEDTPWFCYMNHNRDFADCGVPEEDTEWYDKAAKRVGLCYIKSPIAEGSLVWAKMTGYCKWPGVITKDPSNQLHCLYNGDHKPGWYHVEFLGRCHTHSWVRAPSVKLYTIRTPSPRLAATLTVKERRSCIHGRKKGRRNAFTSSTSKHPERKCYMKDVSVEQACMEANKLLAVSNEERIAMCTFTNTASVVIEAARHADEVGVVITPVLRGGITQDTKENKCLVKTTINNKKQSKHKQADSIAENSFALPDSPASVDACGGPSMANIDLKFPDSLVSHSKEEKLVLDVQMYQRNERAFEHDVLRFMKRNEMTFRGLPRWQNTSISLFQLFLAVHERGGYQQVCSTRGGWVQVYKELTECTNSGEVAKRYYQRNLYPYELFIKGKDFRKILPSKHKLSGKKKRHITKETGFAECVPCKDSSQRLDDSSVGVDQGSSPQQSIVSEKSVDLMEMLGDLETSGNLCCLEEDVLMGKAKLGIDITFFDESPQRPGRSSQYLKVADTASEFGCAAIPNSSDGAQEVPDVSITSSNSSSDDGDQLIHEMQALQEGIDLVDGEMDFL
ncbi:uncharacterized protein [Haliotis asinina]|uniref:uncharacterized protein n=1 Tax=Haliotis asinina TaxID=109174 RepID=UPI003531E95C